MEKNKTVSYSLFPYRDPGQTMQFHYFVFLHRDPVQTEQSELQQREPTTSAAQSNGPVTRNGLSPYASRENRNSAFESYKKPPETESNSGPAVPHTDQTPNGDIKPHSR